MKKIWMLVGLIPLLSFAAIEEEWLQESTEPVELTQENKAVNSEKTQKQRSQIIRRYKRSEVKVQKGKSTASSQKTKEVSQSSEKGKETKNLKRLIAREKKQAAKKPTQERESESFKIETNRKKQSRYIFLEEDEELNQVDGQVGASESN